MSPEQKYKTLAQSAIGKNKDMPKIISLQENSRSDSMSIDLRYFWYPEDDKMAPTKKGISFSIDEIPEMVEIVLDLYRRATGANLILIDGKDMSSEEIYTLLGETSMEVFDQALADLDELLGQ